MSQKNVLMCGLPSSGKTTFLAALWHLLSQRETPTALILSALPQNREYLNSISRKWCRFIKIGHTPTDEMQAISLKLKGDVNEVDLHVPDMSGETWEAVWSTRSYSEGAAEWVQSESGIMLFLHADKIRPPLDIMTRNAMVTATGEKKVEGHLTPWSAKNSPTQVVLVDILQALAMPPLCSSGRRLAVVISAWDKADDTGLEPDNYLQVHFPLLHQFLQFSGSFSEVRIFGVSAQGGDLDSPTDTERLKSEDIPSRRIRVVAGDHTQHDLTLPIQWLIAK